MTKSPCHVKSHFKPYPELVDPQPAPYAIYDSNEVEGMPTTGMVDLSRRLLFVPYDIEGRDTSLHELAHCRWSPRKAPEGYANSGIAQAMEDARLNLGLAHRGTALAIAGSSRKRVLDLARGDLERGELGHFLLRAVASLGTGVEDDLRGLLEGAVARTGTRRLARLRKRRARLRGLRMLELLGETRTRLERARLRQGGDVASFRQGQNVASWLRRALGEIGCPDPVPTPVLLLGCGMGPGHDHDHGDGGDSSVEPGKLTITTAPLLHPCAPPHKRPSRRRRAAEEGTELRFWHRYAVDGQVFARPRRSEGRGGTVLIDTSGSMCLRPEDVEAIIARAPEATQVALYSGTDKSGELRIVVRNGRRAGYEDMKTPGRGNIVDLPCLEWLARQPGPRVWISDGGVTGCGDQASSRIRAACRRVRQRAGIVQVLGADEAAAVLAGRRKTDQAPASAREARRILRESHRGSRVSEAVRGAEEAVRAARAARAAGQPELPF